MAAQVILHSRMGKFEDFDDKGKRNGGHKVLKH